MHALYLYYYENYVGAAMLYTLIIYEIPNTKTGRYKLIEP